MSEAIPRSGSSQLEQMREGGAHCGMAPQVVYANAACPHGGCQQPLHAIDFRLEAFGRAIHDPLERAWWSDVGFAGRCPSCGGWIHFTIRGKRAIDDAEAKSLSQLPANWADEAVIL
jgi:hypothetical protein